MLLLYQSVFSQSKKEQIEILIYQKDSLGRVLEKERKESGERIKLLEGMISSQRDSMIHVFKEEQQKGNEKVRQFEIKISNAKSDMALINNELTQAKKEKGVLEVELQNRNDSIFELLNRVKELEDLSSASNPKLDTIIWEMTDLTWNQIEFNLKILRPAFQFEQPSGRFLLSGDRKIRINYDYNRTYQFDNMDPDLEGPLFFKIEDAVEYYSKGLKDLEVKIEEGFFIKGKNASNELISIKGIYTEFVSMQGRVEGEPSWLWSNTLVLKATVNQKDLVDYLAISDWLDRNFNENSVSYKFDE
jgi:hypothetical protein